MGWLKRENILVDYERHQSIKIENWKQCNKKSDSKQVKSAELNGIYNEKSSSKTNTNKQKKNEAKMGTRETIIKWGQLDEFWVFIGQ